MTKPLPVLLAMVCSCTSGPTFVGETAETGADTDAETGAASESADDEGDDGMSGPIEPAGTTGAGELGPIEQQRCPEIVTESAYCLTTPFGEPILALVGVDTGNSCALATAEDLDRLPTSVAWIDERLVGVGEHGVFRFDLATEAMDLTTEPLMADITEVAGQLLARPLDPELPILQFVAFDDLVAGDPVAELDISPMGSRLATADGILFAAWHATDFVERYDLATGEQLDDLPLVGHDDWVNGMSIVDGRLFLIDGNDQVREFDASTGAHVRDQPLGFTNAGSGLVCRPGL